MIFALRLTLLKFPRMKGAYKKINKKEENKLWL